MDARIKIKSIELINFKGFSYSKHNFEDISELRAETGEGKTSYFDAWKWCLGFSVNSIEPISENNIQIPELETRVNIVIEAKSLEYILSRSSRQLWRLDKVTQIKSFNGNETTFYIDNVELKMNSYKEKISDLFGVDYSSLEMLINLSYFNSTSAKWGWRERRQVLYSLCGVDEIVKQLFDKECYSFVSNDLKKGYSTVEITKSINNEKKFINEGKTRNETLITAKSDELAKYSSYNYDTLQADIAKAEKQLENLIALNNKAIKNTLIAEKLAEIERLTARVSKLQIAHSKALQEKNTELAKLNGQLNGIKAQGSADKAELGQLGNTIARYEKMIADKDAEVFSDSTTCPTCLRKLEDDKIATMQETFEQSKSKQLAELHTSLEKATARKETLSASINSQREEYNALKAKYDLLQATVIDDGEIAKLEEVISELRNETQKLKMAEVNSDKEEKITELKTKITELKGQYAYKTVCDNIQFEIGTLRNESKNLTNREIANEKKRKQLENYVLESISLVDNTINSHFEGVKFRLFDTLTAQANREISECCEAEYQNIAYSSLSSGQKIICDFQVAKGLHKIFNVNYPIFLDDYVLLSDNLTAKNQIVKMITTTKNTNLIGTKIRDIYKTIEAK